MERDGKKSDEVRLEMARPLVVVGPGRKPVEGAETEISPSSHPRHPSSPPPRLLQRGKGDEEAAGVDGFLRLNVFRKAWQKHRPKKTSNATPDLHNCLPEVDQHVKEVKDVRCSVSDPFRQVKAISTSLFASVLDPFISPSQSSL